MIQRALKPEQRAALIKLQEKGGIAPLSLRAHSIALVTIYTLMREKLVHEDENLKFAITGSGRRALVEGLYEKQPQLLKIRVTSPGKSANKPSPSHKGRTA